MIHQNNNDESEDNYDVMPIILLMMAVSVLCTIAKLAH